MYILRFDTEAEFGAFYALYHYGIAVAAHHLKNRVLADVVREAQVAALLKGISTEDPAQYTPAGSRMRQLAEPASLEVDRLTLAMIERYIRAAAVRIGPDWSQAAAEALAIVRAAREP